MFRGVYINTVHKKIWRGKNLVNCTKAIGEMNKLHVQSAHMPNTIFGVSVNIGEENFSE